MSINTNENNTNVLAEVPSVNETPKVLSKLKKWGDYTSVGTPLQGTKLIPMKTPLSTEIIHNMSITPKYTLTIPELLKTQAQLNRHIGCIIDLCNHHCLYEMDIPDSVEYNTVHLIAKQVPSLNDVKKVKNIIENFSHRCPDKYIAIHCAYGFNRTGFIVSSFLIETFQFAPDVAMDIFAKSRCPGIRHEKFIKELHCRYSDCTNFQSSSHLKFKVEDNTCIKVDDRKLNLFQKIRNQLFKNPFKCVSGSKTRDSCFSWNCKSIDGDQNEIHFKNVLLNSNHDDTNYDHGENDSLGLTDRDILSKKLRHEF